MKLQTKKTLESFCLILFLLLFSNWLSRRSLAFQTALLKKSPVWESRRQISDTFTVQKKKRLQSLNTAFNLFLPLITQSVQEELDLISKWHYKRLFSHFLFKFAHKGHCFVAWPTLFTKIDSKKMALPKIEKKMTQYGFSVQSKSDHYCRRTEGSLNTVSNKHI